MKRKPLLAISCLSILLLLSCSPRNPKTGITQERQRQLDTLVSLIKKDRVALLAGRVRYPIKRQNPLPDIQTQADFIAYYPILFDTAFKAKLIHTEFDSTNTIDKYSGFGLFRGDIWLDEDGNIIAINHQSPEEKQRLKQMKQEVQEAMHPGLQPIDQNIFVCQTEKWTVRVDRTIENDFQYASWSSPKTYQDKPDLLLLGGIPEFKGTMGGVTYTFRSGDWTYQVDHVAMAESEEDTGLFLRMWRKDEEVVSYRCVEIK